MHPPPGKHMDLYNFIAIIYGTSVFLEKVRKPLKALDFTAFQEVWKSSMHKFNKILLPPLYIQIAFFLSPVKFILYYCNLGFRLQISLVSFINFISKPQIVSFIAYHSKTRFVIIIETTFPIIVVIIVTAVIKFDKR